MDLNERPSTTPPCNPGYEQDTARRNSFNAWNGRHDTGSLIRAGFFYTGNEDSVRCFHCDIGLFGWNEEDDPWQEHARRSKECHFLLQTKGQAYVTKVVTQNSNSFISNLSVEEARFRYNPVKALYAKDFVLKEPQQSSIHRLSDTEQIHSEINDIAKKNGDAKKTIDEDVQGMDDASNSGNIHERIEGTVSISNIPPSQSSLALDSSTPPPRNPRYGQDTARRESFNAWNGRHDIDSLVKAGLFYTGEQDIVRCFHCDIGLAEWNREDDPWQEHARHSHECHFLIRVKGQAYVNDVQREWSEVTRPDLADVDSRLDTFGNWPRDCVVQTPEQLAKAGFYYAGETDTVRCHYCDGGLREWEPGDIPWVEHAKWFPHCKFVLKIKGLPFIQQCVARRNHRSVSKMQGLHMRKIIRSMLELLNNSLGNTGQWNLRESDLITVMLDTEDEEGKLSSDEETEG